MHLISCGILQTIYIRTGSLDSDVILYTYTLLSYNRYSHKAYQLFRCYLFIGFVIIRGLVHICLYDNSACVKGHVNNSIQRFSSVIIF